MKKIAAFVTSALICILVIGLFHLKFSGDLKMNNKEFGTQWDGVLQWFESPINNGILEGINSLIQACKARARGYRSKENFISMIYLIAGKLQIDLPT